MNKTKIILIVLALSGLGFLAYTLINQKTEDVEEVTLTDNKFINEINKRIDEIKNSEKNYFSKEQYAEIIYLINEYEKNNKISTQWSSNLRKKLEYVYFDKFIKEANYVFNQSNWSSSDIKFIREETSRLVKSEFLQETSGLNPIQRVLKEYDEIKAFLARAKSFSHSNSVSSMNQKFDNKTVGDYINESKAKAKTSSLVKNNQDLIKNLKNIQSWMYQKHLNFFEAKLNKAKSEGYSKYDEDYNRFYNGVCQPMFEDINEFKDIANQKYGVSTNDWYNQVDHIKDEISKIARYAKKDLQKKNSYSW